MSLAWRHRGLLSPWHICNAMSRTCHVSPSVMSVSRARDRVLLPLPSPGANCPLIGQSWQYRTLIGWSHLSPRAADWGLSSHIEAWSCSADNILMHVLYAPSSLCYLAWLVFCLLEPCITHNRHRHEEEHREYMQSHVTCNIFIFPPICSMLVPLKDGDVFQYFAWLYKLKP